MKPRAFVGALTMVSSLVVARTASAQFGEFRPVSVGYEHHAPVNRAGGERLSFNVYRADLTAPLVLREKKSFFFPALNYQHTHAEGTGETPLSLDLHLLTLNVMVLHRFSERWLGVVRTGYGVASDLSVPLSGRDFYFTGYALGIYVLSPQLTLGAGVAYDQRTGSITPVPLGALYWEPARGFSIRGVIPSNVYVSWRAVRPLTLEVTGAFEGQRYNVSNQSLIGGREHRGALASQTIRVGAGARVHLTKFAHIEALAGAILLRRFELFRDDRSDGNGMVPAGPFVGVNLWIGQSGWKEPPPEKPERNDTNRKR